MPANLEEGPSVEMDRRKSSQHSGSVSVECLMEVGFWNERTSGIRTS